MQIAIFGGTARFFIAARRPVDCADAWSERLEDRVKVLHDVGFATYHLTIAAFQSPHTTAGSYVAVVHAFGA